MEKRKNKKEILLVTKRKQLSRSEKDFLFKVEKEVVDYLAIHHSQKHPAIKHYHKSKHFLKWALKLLVPDFLCGHPNLWDNLKTLYQEEKFRPIRMALLSYLIFVITITSTGIYALVMAPGARAATEFSFKTGYFLGTGAAQSITGLGFQPQVLIIKADTAAGSAIWKSSVMPAGASSYFIATADNNETQIILDADGFSVSAAAEVNTVNVRYIYIAFANSDCTADGTMCVGAYSGDGATTKAVTTGFQPDVVWVKRSTAISAMLRTSSMTDNHAAYFTNTADNTAGIFFRTLDATGFTVGASLNTLGGVFYYVAFKNPNTTKRVAVGQFTGDGVDGREITGLGFKPNFVLVKQADAGVPVANITETWGDYSSVFTAAANAVNNIQELKTDGFQTGNSANVNTLNIVNRYVAFGGATAVSPSGTFYMQRGYYDGDAGATKTIDTSFAPDLVFIKADNSAQLAVWSTRMENNLTHYFSSSAVGFANGIISMGTNNFTVGNSATVNSVGVTFEWVAYGNATTPNTGAGAADFIIGCHTGNGIDGRKIDNIGLGPNMVAGTRTITTAALAVWKASAPTMADNTSAYFIGTGGADETTGLIFKTLDAGGFTLGTSATINAAGGAYVWFAFKEGAQFKIGSYTADGNAGDITGVGFAPDYVWIKRSTAVQGVHRSSSLGITGAFSQYFNAVVNAVNTITALIADGFSIGTAAEVNAIGGVYRYAAWKSSTSSSPPNTPSNSSPANTATGQDLNVTLTGSAYVDANSNDQVATQWQVDDDADFVTPVWTRTGGAEITTSVTAGNGTFANELSGKTELNHNVVYYWRVRYSDGVYSNWSTLSSFTTNNINQPTNTTPANESTVTTLTPTLTASAFVDPQSGHSAVSAQWLVNTTNNFSSVLYDSGTVAYNNSFSVPGAVLSDRNSYYWMVRYQDSSGFWSEYSTPTNFLVAESVVTIKPLFGSIVVDQGDAVNIDAQVSLTDSTVINDATVKINIYNPAGAKIISDQAMNYLAGSNGIYRYAYTIPAVSGSYIYEVSANSDGSDGYGAANFEVRTIAADITSSKSIVTSEQTAQTASRVIIEDIAATSTIIKNTTADVQTRVVNIQSNMDILVGAFIVTSGAVADLAATATSFISSLANTTNNFYKNAVLTFTSGALDGQSRRISAYDGVTKAITLDPALSGAPANSDTFSIITQNVRVEEQVADHETAQAAERLSQAAERVAQASERTTQGTFRTDVTSRLTAMKTTVDNIYSLLQTVDTNLDTVATTVNSIRTSQQKNYRVKFSDVSDVQVGQTYRAKLMILDHESNPIDAITPPDIMLYNTTRGVAVAATPMTWQSTGVYEYTFDIATSTVAGLWESIANVDMGGTADIITNDYFQVTGAPAQVLINSISDYSIPSISANVTITNEGVGSYEYRYEWCVVSTEANQCGGGDDVYYASAAKLISPGISFNPTLTATVPTAGNYWFKLVVYYGTEASGASRTFTADSGSELPTTPPTSSGGSGGLAIPAAPASNENIYAEVIKARQQLEVNSQKLSRTLEILGIVSPDIKNLLLISAENADNILKIQNKIADLRAVSSATRRIVEQKTVEPIVETYMKFNSVEIHFLITNPATTAQTVKFKAFLPEEARPEHILELSGLKLDYDANAGVYFVSGDISLGPKETATRKVEMKDIWLFAPEQIKSIKDQANSLVAVLAKTQYDAQGTILKNDIFSTLEVLNLRQEESYSSPQDHIIAFRENKARMAQVESNLAKLKDLVVDAGASRSVVGQVGGIQTFATWGIILAIVFGFCLLAAVIFAMWRHQTMLAMAAMSANRAELEQFVCKPRRRLKQSKNS